MTTEPTVPKLYRPARRGLWFGVASLALQLCASVILSKYTLTSKYTLSDETPVIEVTPLVKSVPALVLVAHVALLASVGYSAIAAHRREWNRMLVANWLVIAAIHVLPYVLP